MRDRKISHSSRMYRWGSWLFLVGSGAFCLDASLGIQVQLSWRSALYLIGSVIFGLGCICFVIDAGRSQPPQSP